jgi:hypothetical protein
MDGLAAIETINSWRRILIEGSADSVSQTLVDIETTLREAGWRRDPDSEVRFAGPSGRKDAWRCFIGGLDKGPRVMLGLARVSDRRVRGGTYSLLDGPAEMQPTDVARVIEWVIREVVVPTASKHRARVTIPRLGYLSRVPPKTLASLRVFSDLAAGTWPLNHEQERSWRRFVINASREDAAFDIDELLDWFVTNGWSSEDGRRLTDKFQNEAALISEFQEESSS